MEYMQPLSCMSSAGKQAGWQFGAMKASKESATLVIFHLPLGSPFA